MENKKGIFSQYEQETGLWLQLWINGISESDFNNGLTAGNNRAIICYCFKKINI